MKYIEHKPVKQLRRAYPLATIQERLLIWERVRGIWKNKKPDPIEELNQMREEW